MADKKTKDDNLKKKKSESGLVKFIIQRRSYFIGIIIATVLIVVNVVVGLMVINLVTNIGDIEPEFTRENVSVPEINEDAYNNFKQDHLNRQQKDLIDPPLVDPFNT